MFEKLYFKITCFNINKKSNLKKQNQILFAPKSTTSDSNISP